MLPEKEGNMSWDKEEVVDISGRTPEYTTRTDTLDIKPSSFVRFRSELRSATVNHKLICMPVNNIVYIRIWYFYTSGPLSLFLC